MEGIDALNSWKPDLGDETGHGSPQRPKRGQKFIGQCVLCDVPPLRLLLEFFFFVYLANNTIIKKIKTRRYCY